MARFALILTRENSLDHAFSQATAAREAVEAILPDAEAKDVPLHSDKLGCPNMAMLRYSYGNDDDIILIGHEILGIPNFPIHTCGADVLRMVEWQSLKWWSWAAVDASGGDGHTDAGTSPSICGGVACEHCTLARRNPAAMAVRFSGEAFYHFEMWSN